MIYISRGSGSEFGPYPLYMSVYPSENWVLCGLIFCQDALKALCKRCARYDDMISLFSS